MPKISLEGPKMFQEIQNDAKYRRTGGKSQGPVETQNILCLPKTPLLSTCLVVSPVNLVCRCSQDPVYLIGPIISGIWIKQLENKLET